MDACPLARQGNYPCPGLKIERVANGIKFICEVGWFYRQKGNDQIIPFFL